MVAFTPTEKKFAVAKAAFEFAAIKEWIDGMRLAGAKFSAVQVRAGGTCTVRRLPHRQYGGGAPRLLFAGIRRAKHAPPHVGDICDMRNLPPSAACA